MYYFYILSASLANVILLVLFSAILENVLNLKLIIHSFKWRKSKDMAEGAANVNAILFFLVSFLTLQYNVHIKRNAPPDYAFWKWLVVMLPLAILVRIVYYKYTAKDFTKKGFHID